MTALETEVAMLKQQLARIEERVRLDAVAEAFAAGRHEVRQGDYFILCGEMPTRLTNVSSDGRWTYFGGQYVLESFHVPEHERLYTIAEVAEIVAKLRKERDELAAQVASRREEDIEAAERDG